MFQAQHQISQTNEIPPPFMAICPPNTSGMDQQSFGTTYPILNDYTGLELSTLALNKNIAIPFQNASTQQVTNGVRKVKRT